MQQTLPEPVSAEHNKNDNDGQDNDAYDYYDDDKL